MLVKITYHCSLVGLQKKIKKNFFFNWEFHGNINKLLEIFLPLSAFEISVARQEMQLNYNLKNAILKDVLVR